MRSLSVLAVAGVLLTCCATPSANAEHRVALLIGNSDYADDTALASPPQDIRAIAAVLQKFGFRITLATNVDRDTLDDSIHRFISSAPINGTAFVYFSGYVLTTKPENEPEKPILLTVEGNQAGLPLNELMDWLFLHSATSHNVIVLDGCNARSRHSTTEGPPGISAVEHLPPDTWLGYADRPDDVIKPAADGLSTFANLMSTSKSSSLATLLNTACGWTKSTCPKQPFAESASVAVAAPDEFPETANVGDEWVAFDGTVFCWCPSMAAGDGFWIGKYEVPQCKWPIPNLFGGIGRQRNLPVTQLRTTDILARLATLTHAERKAGRLPEDREYALPSPEQWEHAARAGSTGDRYFDDRQLVRHANFADRSLFDTNDDDYLYADKRLNDGMAQMAPVGSYLANAWGLHDVYGNVWEQTDTGVLCGGSWVSLPDYCRAAVRKPPLKFPSDFVGLRIVVRKVRSNKSHTEIN